MKQTPADAPGDRQRQIAGWIKGLCQGAQGRHSLIKHACCDGITLRTVENVRSQLRKAELAGLANPGLQGLTILATTAPHLSHQSSDGRTPINRSLDLGDSTLAEPRTATFIAVRKPPASHQQTRAIGAQNLTHAARSGSDDSTRSAPMGAEQSDEAIRFENQCAKANVAGEELTSPRVIGGTRQARAKSAGLPYRQSHAGIREGRLDRKSQLQPCPIDSLPQCRRPCLPMSQWDPVAMGEQGSRPAAAPVHPYQKFDLGCHVHFFGYRPYLKQMIPV